MNIKMIDQPDIRHKIQLDLPSVAVTLEALEQILVEQGILSEGQLMKVAAELAKVKIIPGGDG